MLQTVYLLLNASCTTFSSSVCVCVWNKEAGETDAGRKKCAVFLESPVFRLWHLTAEEGMNRCTLFMRLTGVPESSLLSPLCWQASRRSSADLLWAVLVSPPSPVAQPRAGPTAPAGGTLTGDSSDVPGILLKKKPLCVLCSLKCKAYFIPYEPNSLQWLDALVVCCRWKTEVQRLGCVCFGIWLWSRCSSGRGPDGGGDSPRLSTEPCTCKLLVVSTKIRSEAIPS